MKKKIILLLMMVAMLCLGLCIGALSRDKGDVLSTRVYAAETDEEDDSEDDEDYEDEDDEDYEDEDDEDYEDEDDEDYEDDEDEDEDDSSSSSKSKSTSSKTSTSTSTSTSRVTTTETSRTSVTSRNTVTSGTSRVGSQTTSSQSRTDAKGNTLLLTESQRRARFRSKTNPKRGTKPVSVPRPNSGMYVYADFGTFNSYNSENGMGGTPVYLIGTIMQIEKVSYNALQFQVVLLVNDCDGYQWYMRADVNKAEFETYKALYLGKSGYIFGIYSGYSGVTNRPMMDVALIVPSAVSPDAAVAANAAAANAAATKAAAVNPAAAAAMAATTPAVTAVTPTVSPTAAPAVPAVTPAPTPAPTAVPATPGTRMVVITPLPLPAGYKYVVNTDTKKIHYPTCQDVKKILQDNIGYTGNSIAELATEGYTTCGHCNPRD